MCGYNNSKFVYVISSLSVFCWMLVVIFTYLDKDTRVRESASIFMTISAYFYFASLWLGQIFVLYLCFGGFFTMERVLFKQ